MRKGFSLLELSLVIFILLLGSAALYTGLSPYRQKSALRFQQNSIEQDLLQARELSRAQLLDTEIIFFADGYTIQAGNGALKTTTLRKPFTVSALRLGFNAAGNPRFAGTLYLYRSGQAAARMTVTVGSGLLKWTDL